MPIRLLPFQIGAFCMLSAFSVFGSTPATTVLRPPDTLDFNRIEIKITPIDTGNITFGDTLCPVVGCIEVTAASPMQGVELEFDPRTTKGTPEVGGPGRPLTLCYRKITDRFQDTIAFIVKMDGVAVGRKIRTIPIRWRNDAVPNAFTPNDDGINDRFRPVFPCKVAVLYFAVYNRWGEKVFETTNEKEAWDGKVNGVDAPPDVYFWLANYEAIRKGSEAVQSFPLKGDVTLLR